MVYFIQGELTRLVKIGKTGNRNALSRLGAMQGGSPDKLILLGTIPGHHAEEQWLHEYFSKYRAHREWFNPDPDMMKMIDDLISGRLKLRFQYSHDLENLRSKVKMTLTEEDVWRKI